MRAVQTDCDLGAVNGLTALFRPDQIERTLIHLCKKSDTSSGLAPQTLFSYALCLKRTLAAQGLDEEAAKARCHKRPQS